MVLFLPYEGAEQQVSLDSEAAVEPHLSRAVSPPPGTPLCPQQRWVLGATNHSTHTASGVTLLRTARGSRPEHQPAKPRVFTALRSLLAKTGWRKAGGTST